MKFMITWRTRPGFYNVAVHKFLKTGGKPPEGLKTVGRWHVPGSILGWHLLEGDDPTAVAEHVAEWADMIELEVNPVIEDTAAARGGRGCVEGRREIESPCNLILRVAQGRQAPCAPFCFHPQACLHTVDNRGYTQAPQ